MNKCGGSAALITSLPQNPLFHICQSGHLHIEDTKRPHPRVSMNGDVYNSVG